MATTEELLERIRERRGYLLTSHEFMAKEDPDYLEAYENLCQGILETRVLSAKLKELMVACMELTRCNESSAKTHMKKAFAVGATKSEVFESLKTCAAVYTGDILLGVKVLAEVLEELKKEGHDIA